MVDDAEMLTRIDDYLAGRLSEEEADIFEEALLESVSLQQEVLVAREFRAGLHEVTDQLLDERVSFLQRIHLLVRSSVWAYSATLATVFAVLWIVGKPQVQTGQQIVDKIVYVDQMRSTSNQQVEVVAGQHTLLSIDAAAFGREPFTITISGEAGVTTRLGPLRSNDEFEVNVAVPNLISGRYQLSLLGDAAELNFDLIVLNPG